MKTNKSITIALCTATVIAVAAAVMAIVQCNKIMQQTSATHSVVCDSVPAVKIAYVDIDTLLTNYNLWVELNEEMIRKEEEVRATLNEKFMSLQADAEDFERKLNNNAFVSRQRAEAEQSRILKKQQDLERLQERLTNELLMENDSEIIRISPLRHLTSMRHNKKYISYEGHMYLYATEKVLESSPVTETLFHYRHIRVFLIILLPHRIISVYICNDYIHITPDI
jgi:outer membrane protein